VKVGRRAEHERRLDGNVGKPALVDVGPAGVSRKRPVREVGPPGVSRKRAVLAGNVTPSPSGDDAQPARLRALGAQVQGSPSAPSDEKGEALSEKARLRELRARFPGKTGHLTTLPARFSDDRAELPAEPAGPRSRSGRLPTQPAPGVTQPARLPTRPATIVVQPVRLCRLRRDERSLGRGSSVRASPADRP
jgi:hypothetical protein